eukprot:jgi/Tetstr1/457191/TSEL_043840.t1
MRRAKRAKQAKRGLVERVLKMTHQPRRDLECWWVADPNHSNGRSIYTPVETAYMHADSSGYGVMYDVLTFLSELRGGQVLLHEDNMGMVHVLANLTSRSPLQMTKLQKLWFVLDSDDISIRASYTKTTANIWDDRLSREID